MATSSHRHGVVLLSAGRGSRMLPLTEGIPKSLLRVGDRLVLDWLLEAVLARTDGEVVVVTGYAAERVEAHLCRYGERVRDVRNERYLEDVNILSVEVGVSALKHPERGYLIVETDILLDDSAWDQIFDVATGSARSHWICKGVYGPHLTGGIVHTRPDGAIDAVDYRPLYDPLFDGWAKMVGLLLVGPDEVAEDRRLRQAGISRTLAQYYLNPWLEGVDSLPSRLLQLGDDCFAQSFNTQADFQRVSRDFLALAGEASPAKVASK